MTYKEVATMLGTLNVPISYYEFSADTAEPPPFICFYYPRSEDMMADNKNYAKIRTLDIELYTDNKDFALEAQIESLLESNGLPYIKDESYIEDEQMFEVIFETSILVEEEPTEDVTPVTEEDLNG